jgi:hypothetical protein
VTRAVREELDEYFTADYGRFVEIAGEVRRELREKSVSPGASAWNRALQGDFRRLIKEGRLVQAKEVLLETLGAKS